MAYKPSRHCTADLLEYLRFFKGLQFVATEVSYNACQSDVLALSASKKTVSEFEVKMTKADFRKDFTKTLGHKRYAKEVLKHASYVDEDSGKFAPHYFWFVVPLSMQEYALDYLEQYPNYGLLVWDTEGISKYSPRNPVNTRILVARSASLIKKNSRPKSAMETIEKKIVQRATSELTTLRLKEFKDLA